MNTLQTIVVATDFSPASLSAVRQAIRIRALTGAALHVVHATRRDRAEALQQLAPKAEEVILEHLHAEASERLGGLELPEGVSVHTPVGKPATEIRAAAESVGADLIVLGATGSSGRRLGTVAGRCVRSCRTPILLVPEGREGPFEHVLATIDLSDMSARIMAGAAALAKLDDASCSAVHVYEAPWDRARWGGVPSGGIEQLDQVRSLLERRLAKVVSESGGDVDVEVGLIESPEYANAIVDDADRRGADVIVTGTTGRTAIGYFVLGTTAEKLMRDSDCAVLSIHEP